MSTTLTSEREMAACQSVVVSGIPKPGASAFGALRLHICEHDDLGARVASPAGNMGEFGPFSRAEDGDAKFVAGHARDGSRTRVAAPSLRTPFYPLSWN